MEENQRQLVSDAVDYEGNPADRTASGGWVAATLILGEFLHYFSTYSIIKLLSFPDLYMQWFCTCVTMDML